MIRITRDQLLMGQAMLTAMRSTCTRKQVGAIIARSGRIISSGYAGAPAGMPHCMDIGCDTSGGGGCQRTAHAEANAIAYAARHGISTDGSTLYCTLSPCTTCAKSIINAGIKRVIFQEAYRDQSGVKLLLESGIECIHQTAVSVSARIEPTQSVSPPKSSEQGELFSLSTNHLGQVEPGVS